jgi:hypothetical protein
MEHSGEVPASTVLPTGCVVELGKGPSYVWLLFRRPYAPKISTALLQNAAFSNAKVSDFRPLLVDDGC